MAPVAAAAASADAGPLPQFRFLADGDVAVMHDDGDAIHIWLMDKEKAACFGGRLAEAVRALLAENKADNPALAAIGRWHPWLRHLAEAKARPHDLPHLLLGTGLDMLFVELTAQCNERCLHCYAEAEPERVQSLTLPAVNRLLAEARTLGCSTVQFTGGDPLLYPDLVPTVAEARRLGFDDIEIYSNGLRLSPALLARLAPFQPGFAFSVYSHDAATHDTITRTPGSHGRTLAAIRRCLEAGLEARISVIVMPENRGHEQQTRRFLMDTLGIASGRIGFDTVKGTGRGSFFDYEIEYDDVGSAASEERSPGRNGKLCVAADGAVYPCIFSRHTRLGDIHAATLAQIIAGLDGWRLPPPSNERWRACREGLTCTDCQVIAYVLGDGEAHDLR